MNLYVSGFAAQFEHLDSFLSGAGLLVLLKGIIKEDWKYYFFRGIFFVYRHYLINKSLHWKTFLPQA